MHVQLHKRYVNFVNENTKTENEIIQILQCKAAAPPFQIVSAIHVYIYGIIYHAICT